MDTTDLETITPKLIEDIKISNRQTGNSFTEATKVMKIIFPNGIAGKEQDAFAIYNIITKMFRISNAGQEEVSKLWLELNAYALSGLKASSQ